MVADPCRADALSDRDNLVCLVGGDEDGVAAARPVLEAIVGTVQETGGSGSAQLARAAYTLQTTAQMISAVEADALYRAVRDRRPRSTTYGARGRGDARGRAGAGRGEHRAFRRHVHR